VERGIGETRQVNLRRLKPIMRGSRDRRDKNP
jgi:hypothetical protein